MKNIFKIIFALQILLYFGCSIVIAHGDGGEKVNADKSHSPHSSEKHTTVKPAGMKEHALSELKAGLNFMALTMSDEKNKEMLSNGPIMHEWHNRAMKLNAAIATLEKLASSLDEKSKIEAETALERISDSLDEFHIITHSTGEGNDLTGRLTRGRAEVKKAESALERLVINLH